MPEIACFATACVRVSSLQPWQLVSQTATFETVLGVSSKGIIGRAKLFVQCDLGSFNSALSFFIVGCPGKKTKR